MRIPFLAIALLSLASPLAAQAPGDTAWENARQRIVNARTSARANATSADNALAAFDSLRARAYRAMQAPPVVVTPPVVTPPVVVTPPAPPIVVVTPPPVIQLPPEPLPPVSVGVGDRVQYPNDSIAFLLGPQLRSGSAANPWPWFDTNELAMALRWTQQFRTVPSDPFVSNYYDVAMAQYGEYYRTGNDTILAGARERADKQYASLVFNQAHYGGSAPRTLMLTGVMLRALDGHPEYWPFILKTVRDQYQGWLGLRLDYPTLYFGVRDGSYMLMYATMLAKVHPNPAVRAEMLANASKAASWYFLRLQSADGGWYWTDDSGKAPGGVLSQPFEVGLLLEAFSYLHQLTGDTAIAASIPRAVDWLQGFYRGDELVMATRTPPKPLDGRTKWRNLPYFVYTNGTWNSAVELPGGWDTNTLREARQANSTVVAAYGYAYQLTHDPKYRAWGDEMFAATYGRGKGPLADSYSGLADYQEKEFGQAYRSAGRYLVWRGEVN